MTYKRTSKVQKEDASRFSEQFITTTFVAESAITNTHSFALSKIIVRDTLPTSEDEKRVRVILREPGILAETAQGDQNDVGDHKVAWCAGSGKKEGLYEWRCSVDASKQIILTTSWDVKSSADVKWTETH